MQLYLTEDDLILLIEILEQSEGLKENRRDHIIMHKYLYDRAVREGIYTKW